MLRSMSLISKPRLYGDVLASKPKSYADYSELDIKWGRQEDYHIMHKIGKGEYSEAFEGRKLSNDQKVVIKVVKPIHIDKIQREIKILQVLNGGPNIPNILDIVKDSASNTPSIVLEYAENEDLKTLYPQFTDFDIRYYIYELLKTLDFTHSSGIMHRDIKPDSVMIDHPNRKLKLIDWDSAEFYVPETAYNERVASRYFKAPELLVNNQYYDYSLDMWNLGAMFASMIFRKGPIFRGKDNIDQLIQIARVLGTPELNKYLEKYQITLDSKFEGKIDHYIYKPWYKYVTLANKPLANETALDLLSKVLKYDQEERILPKEALSHPYFKPVDELWEVVKSSSAIPYSPNSPAYNTAKILKEQNSVESYKL